MDSRHLIVLKFTNFGHHEWVTFDAKNHFILTSIRAMETTGSRQIKCKLYSFDACYLDLIDGECLCTYMESQFALVGVLDEFKTLLGVVNVMVLRH